MVRVQRRLGSLGRPGDDLATTDKQEGYNELYPTGHKFLGLTDVFGERTNAVSGNIDLLYRPNDDLIFMLQGHALARMEPDNDTGRKYSGTEANAHVIHPIGQGAKLRGMYGVFVPRRQYWGDNDPIHYFEAQFGYDF